MPKGFKGFQRGNNLASFRKGTNPNSGSFKNGHVGYKSRLGDKLSAEECIKMSERMKGNVPWNKGKVLTTPEMAKRADRRGHLKKRYGITLELYEELYIKQGGNCAICGQNKLILDVDHCHDTGKMRGLLCHRCNWASGIFGDDPILLRKALDYFVKWHH